MTITRADIATQLVALGLVPGAHVLVHSSLSRMGHVSGGAPAVVAALLDVVGETGTVLAPTLTGSPDLRPTTSITFDAATSAGHTGVIPETLRAWPGAVRSLHATHSVAAVGARSRDLTAGHLDTLTPCGPWSPYERLAADPSGTILLLGCDHESSTTLHCAEELTGVDYHLYREPATATVRGLAGTYRRSFFLHRYGTPRRFSRIEGLLRERGLQRDGRIGQAEARLMAAADLLTLATQALRACPTFFVADGVTRGPAIPPQTAV